MGRGDAIDESRPSVESIRFDIAGYHSRIDSHGATQQAALQIRKTAFTHQNCAESDRFDDLSHHGLVLFRNAPRVAFRLRRVSSHDLANTYTAQSYDLTPLGSIAGPFVELGRFCHHGPQPDPQALRLAWAAIGAFVDGQGAQMIFGCCSLPGSDPARHADLLARLRTDHLGPAKLRPGRKSPLACDLPETPRSTRRPVPPLLRSYLSMGGWVSDHAVVDPELDTVHVFTGLAVADIPETRKARLRVLARAARAGARPLDAAAAAP